MTVKEKAKENYTKVYLQGDMSLDTEEKYFAYTKGYCKGHTDGLAESRKELEKENTELKAQIEKMKCCETEIQIKAKNRFLENLKLISSDIYKKYCETDFVELRRCQNRLNQSKG